MQLDEFFVKEHLFSVLGEPTQTYVDIDGEKVFHWSGVYIRTPDGEGLAVPADICLADSDFLCQRMAVDAYCFGRPFHSFCRKIDRGHFSQMCDGVEFEGCFDGLYVISLDAATLEQALIKPKLLGKMLIGIQQTLRAILMVGIVGWLLIGMLQAKIEERVRRYKIKIER